MKPELIGEGAVIMGITRVLNTAMNGSLVKKLKNFLLDGGVGPAGKTYEQVMNLSSIELMQDVYIDWLFPTDLASDASLAPHVDKDSELVGYFKREIREKVYESFIRILSCYKLAYSPDKKCIIYDKDYESSIESSEWIYYLYTVQRSLIIFGLYNEEAALRGYAGVTSNDEFALRTKEIADETYPVWNTASAERTA
jgi:hypothetical protein